MVDAIEDGSWFHWNQQQANEVAAAINAMLQAISDRDKDVKHLDSIIHELEAEPVA